MGSVSSWVMNPAPHPANKVTDSGAAVSSDPLHGGVSFSVFACSSLCGFLYFLFLISGVVGFFLFLSVGVICTLDLCVEPVSRLVYSVRSIWILLQSLLEGVEDMISCIGDGK